VLDWARLSGEKCKELWAVHVVILTVPCFIQQVMSIAKFANYCTDHLFYVTMEGGIS